MLEVTECRDSVDGKGSLKYTFDPELKKIDLTMDMPLDMKDDATVKFSLF